MNYELGCLTFDALTNLGTRDYQKSLIMHQVHVVLWYFDKLFNLHKLCCKSSNILNENID